jgi:hypothetical protein
VRIRGVSASCVSAGAVRYRALAFGRQVLLLSICHICSPDFRSETCLVYFLFLLALTLLLGLIEGLKTGAAWTLDAHSLLGKLASPAERIDFQRTTQQCELSQAGCTFEKLVHFGRLNVMYPPALDAKDMMMRLHVAVVTRNIVQERYLARLPHFAKLLQNPMDCGE